jgi:hypothetical protein
VLRSALRRRILAASGSSTPTAPTSPNCQPLSRPRSPPPSGSVKALLRLYKGSVKALLRLYKGSAKAL